MADSFIRLTLRDGSTHTVAADGDSDAIVKQIADSTWIELEGGGAVARRLVAASQVVQIELFERA